MSHKISWGIIMAVTGVFVTKADIALATREMLPVDPSVLFVALSLFFLCSVLVIKPWGDRLAAAVASCAPVVLAFLVLVVVGLVGAFEALKNDDEGYRFIFFPLFDFYVFLTAIAIGSIGISEASKRFWMFAAFTAYIGSIVVDVIYPNTFSISLFRAAGMAMNPNGGAFVVILLAVFLVGWGRASARVGDFAVLIIGLVAVLLTLSRAGVAIYLVVIAAYVLSIRGTGRQRVATVIGGVGVVGGLLAVLWLSVGIHNLPPSTAVTERFFIGGSENAFEDASIKERTDAMTQSLELIGEAPFGGHGTGASYRMAVGPHNMYLSAWVDNGVFGVGAYVLLMAALIGVNKRFGNLQGVMLAITTTLFSFASHNVLEDRSILLLIGMSTAAAGLARARRERSVRP